MNVLIFGLGLHNGGYSAAMYYTKRNYKVTITDIKCQNEFGKLVDALTDANCQLRLGEHRKEDFLYADLIIKNPAIRPDNYFLTLNSHITTDIVSLLRFLEGNNHAHIIAISGTKGKSSTTNMITQVLRTFGQKVFFGGNIGISGYVLIEEIEAFDRDKDFYVVLELSSWQIRDLSLYGKDVDIIFDFIIITNLYPDHGDYYNDVRSYYKEKLEILSYNAHRTYLSVQAKEAIDSLSIKIGSNVQYLEPRNLVIEPLLYLGFDERSIQKALSSYIGLPHRREVVAIKNLITWINDSSATIPQAMNYTLSEITTPYILIFGGSDKNSDIEVSLKYLQEAFHLIVLDGSFTQTKIIPFLEKESLSYSGPFDDMKDAVMEGYRKAHTYCDKITVVLSPGAASFGPFLNSDERGNLFKKYVLQLS
jgi:UDP-N-acetylmuramoylalanine--D-glutamate ligase